MNDLRLRFWATPSGWAVIVLIAGAGYLVLSEHQAHSIAVLPVTTYLLSGWLQRHLEAGSTVFGDRPFTVAAARG